jgi:hypothetical protein
MCDSIYHKQVGKYYLSCTERDMHTCNSVIFEQYDEQNKKIILIVNYDMRREFENMCYEDDVEWYLIRRRGHESIRRLSSKNRLHVLCCPPDAITRLVCQCKNNKSKASLHSCPMCGRSLSDAKS